MEDRGDQQLLRNLSNLLAGTETAHGGYEAEVLQGSRDEDWPKWYAGYLLEHGLLDLFPGSGAAAQLDAHLDELLSEADGLHRANAPDEKWHDYYARFLVSRVGAD